MTTSESAQPIRILVVDDETSIRTALAELLREEGYEVHSATDGYKALGRIDTWEPDVVITDVQMPALGGIELMAKVRERLPDVSVVVMTAYSTVEGAVEAMQLGADDYLSKPVSLPQVLMTLRRTLANRALKREAAQLRKALAERDQDVAPGIVGESRTFRDLLALAQQVAAAPVSVLISGEGGTGKHSLAQQIHRWSGRAGLFVTVECGELGDGAEAQLLAARDEAKHGTLFLADVDLLPAGAQAKLLRLLQDPTVEGAARLLAATSHDLAAEVAAGRFRQDLFYRLGVVHLHVPSLRERQDDISPLARHFLKRLVRQTRKPISGFSERALGVLMSFEWPGNVRQLEHCIERAVTVARGRELEPRDLPRELMARTAGDDAPPVIPGSSMHELERWAILRTLEHVGGSTSKAAKILGISPRKIQYRIQEYRTGAPPSSDE